jgi:hypothetical protein
MCVCACVRGGMFMRSCIRVCVYVCVVARKHSYACARVDLLIQYATRSCHIFNFLAPLYFLAFSHKRHDFRRNLTEHKMCFYFLYKFI